MRKDFEIAREVHSQLYDGIEVDLETMDKWEEDFRNDVYGIEEKVEGYVNNSLNANNEAPDSQKKKVGDKGKTKSTITIETSTPELLPTSEQASSQPPSVEKFGQPSVIARALINNLIKGDKIG